MKNDEMYILNDEELEGVTGGVLPTEEKYKTVEKTVGKLWLKVPEAIRDKLLETYRTCGAKAAVALGNKLLEGHFDWALPMLELFK